MTFAQERLVFHWLLGALGVAAVIGALRYPWLWILASLIWLLFAAAERPVEHPYSAAHFRQRDEELMKLFDSQRWLYPYYAIIGVAYVFIVGAMMTRRIDLRGPYEFWSAMALLVPLLLPILVAHQYELYQHLGAQSNQPLHPTPAGGQTAADGAGERRR
jgi:hypothetical protein